MDIEWIYARYSHIMKQYGGPEKFVKYIVDKTNKKWLAVVIPSGSLLIPLAGVGVYHISQVIKEKRKLKDYIVLEETVLDDKQDN